METLNAPDLTPGYPSKGARLGPAWSEAWAEFTKYPEEWRDGMELWTRIAARHELHPDSLRALLYRMAKAGILERKTGQVITDKGKRTRAQFRYVPKEK